MKNAFDTRQIECDRCGAKTQNEHSANHDGWDWFTGHNSNTTHWCSNCLKVAGSIFTHEREKAMRSNA